MNARQFDTMEDLRFFLDFINYVSGDEPAVGGIDSAGAFLAFYEDGEGDLPLVIVRAAERDAHDDDAEQLCVPVPRDGRLYFPVYVLAGEFHEPTFDPATAQELWEQR